MNVSHVSVCYVSGLNVHIKWTKCI